MPVFLRYAGFMIFFWSNENGEPIHFHIAEGNPTANSTKIWILSNGSFKLANNNSKIPLPMLRRIFAIMQRDLENYKDKWQEFHGEIHYYN